MVRVVGFQVPYSERFTIEVSPDARVLEVQVIGTTRDVPAPPHFGEPVLFVLTDDAARPVDREFVTVKTGQPVPPQAVQHGRYVGTVQALNGRAQFQIWEMG